MNVVDLLITIVVVTILVTIVLAVITYIAYKLRLARQPPEDPELEGDLRYFVRFLPPEVGQGQDAHATEA
jgi:heme/copper-type cytochrome/quinol oxidase subunit 2